MLQSKSELENWHRIKDPWGYEENHHDQIRKKVVLSEIPDRNYEAALDIGCGQGFLTKELPGKSVVGVDVSDEAIRHANLFATERVHFLASDLFALNESLSGSTFDLVVITGVLYPQYVGAAHNLIYDIVDRLLSNNGILLSVHVNEWYSARFPYIVLKEFCYPYRDYYHRLEVYAK